MAKFRDCLDREWSLRLTLGHRAGMKDLGVDMKDFGAAVTALSMATAMDAEKLVRVCHLLTVNPPPLAEYEAGFDAVTIDAAGEALAEAVADFYLARQPKLAAAMKAKLREAMGQMDEAMTSHLTRSDLVTNSPAKSA